MTLEQKIEELIITRRLAGKFNVGSAVVAHALLDANNEEVEVGASGSSFYRYATARVDASGNDATGVVGDLGKPFLTVQAAINAIEAGSYVYPIIDIGNSRLQGTVTTSLPLIRFVGMGDEARSGGDYFSKVCVSLVLTGVGGISVELCGCEVDSIVATTVSTVTVTLEHGGIAGNDGVAISTVGAININGDGRTSAAVLDEVSSSAAGQIHVRNAYVHRINSAGSNVIAEKFAYIHIINPAANVSMSDSRSDAIIATGTISYSDELLTNIVFPDSDPHIAGAAYWVAGVLTKSAG